MASILLVDDDMTLCENVKTALDFDHQVVVANDGQTALREIEHGNFDAIILDWELPDIPGTEVAKACRDRSRLTPIMMLTGRSAVDDLVEGLDSGADDYLTKPFNMRELQFKMNALLRGLRGTPKRDCLQMGSLTIDRTKHSVIFAGRSVELRAQEFALLELLVSHPERVFGLDALRTKLWNGTGSDDAIRACIWRVREKLGADTEEVIQTIQDLGYTVRQE
jgi:DNA-binding response OmpR family regulator